MSWNAPSECSSWVLMKHEAPRRDHDEHEALNGPRSVVRAGSP